MSSWASSRFEKLLLALIGLRFGGLAVSGFLALAFPDVWRQVVTLGVSMRYWSRWTLEAGASHPLLPAVLDAADTQGIMPMEFPFLNLLTAPCFALGPHLGRGFAILTCNSLAFGLALLNARIWRGKKISGIDAYPAMLLLPIFSICTQWSGKFMPDFLSVVLACIAVGLSWSEGRDAGREARPLRAFAAATLGLLLKPTAVVVLPILLAHPRPGRKLVSVARWALPAVGLTYLYYRYGIAYIGRYQELPSLVGVAPRSFTGGFVEFFRHLPFVFDFYLKRAFFFGGSLLVLAIAAWSRYARGRPFPGVLWAISGLQFLAVTVIDGGNLFYDHYYYLLGLGPVLCLLFADAFEKSERRWLPSAALLAGLVIPLIEISTMELKTLYRRPPETIWTLDRQTRELRARHPEFPWRQGRAFRTRPEIFPMLGLYFGEISGSARARYGFFYLEEGPPAGCQAVDRSELVGLATCTD